MTSRARFLVAVAAAVAVLAALAARAAGSPAPAGTVTFLSGQAQRMAAGKAQPLAVGAPVYAGDVIETQKRTRLELKLADQSVLRLGPAARIDLSAATFGRSVEERQVSAKLKVGTVWAKVAKTVGGESRFEVRTENAVAGVRGTTFRVDASKDKSVVVKVYGGTVAVAGGGVPRPIHGGAEAEPEPARTDAADAGRVADAGTGKKVRKQVAGPRQVTKEQWEKIVTSMMAVKVSADGTASEPEPFAIAGQGQDEWETWNRERDAAP